MITIIKKTPRNSLFILLCLILMHTKMTSQTINESAKQYLIDAETAFNDDRYSDCLDKLNASYQANGWNSTVDIQYLKVKTLIRLEKYYEAKVEREKYLTLAKGNISETDRKYIEMKDAINLIDKNEKQTIATNKAEQKSILQNDIKSLDKQIKIAFKNGKGNIGVDIGCMALGFVGVGVGYMLGDDGDFPRVLGGIIGGMGAIFLVYHLSDKMEVTSDLRKQRRGKRKQLASYSFNYTPVFDAHNNYCSAFTLTIKLK